MSENNYGVLMMKSTVGVSDDINNISSPGIYLIPPSNPSSPDSLGGVLTIHSGSPIRRTFISDSVICLTSTKSGNSWTDWRGPLSRANPFADIKSDGATAIAEALSNLGFGQSIQREGYLIWPGGLIMQWGTLTGNQGNLGAGYPIAFKERAYQALASLNDKTDGAVDGISLYITTANLTNKTSLIVLNKGKDLLGVTTASYFVIGK